MAADFHGTGMSTGPHPMAFVRADLERQGIVSAAHLARIQHGQRAAVAGIVVVRQRPGTAKRLRLPERWKTKPGSPTLSWRRAASQPIAT